MTDDSSQPSAKDATPPWRSKKYVHLSDEEILALALRQLPEKDRWYLLKELDYRNLNEQAVEAKRYATKKEMRSKPWWKYIPLLFALTFLAKGIFNSFK